MAKPTYYPDWATQDTTLPATGKANKVRPKETIRNIGWDKGQIPTAEEVNWMFNNWGLWIHYFADEFIPTLPNTYLPKNGTAISFSGDLQGTISWSGNNQGTGNIQVVDNSHNHLSANITDATPSPVPNMIVKRNEAGSIYAGDIISRGSNPNDSPAYFWETYEGRSVGSINSDIRDGGSLNIFRVRPSDSAIVNVLNLYDDGHTSIQYPRSSTAQEGQPDSLVRFDYYWQNLTNTNNSVNNVNNDLQNYKNGAYNTFIAGIRQSSEIGLDNSNFTDYSNGRKATVPAGAFMTGVADVSTGKQYIEDVDQIFYKYQQYAIGGNWYNQGSL